MNSGVLSSLFRKMFSSAGDEVAGKIASQYSDDAIRTLARSSADDIAAKQGNLIATHQLTPDKLASASELGGFVQPSMAVVDPSKGTNFLPGSDFGDIVMVANRNAINPKVAASKSIIGDRDIYSPRFPDTSHQVNMGALDDILAQHPGNSKQYALSNLRLEDEAKYSPFMQEIYKNSNPQYADMWEVDLRNVPEFQSFADDAFTKLRGDKVIDYRTPSGNWKELPYTAENANKVMNKSASVGGEQFHTSPGANAYHQNTKRINSLDDLYKNKYRFIDSKTGELTKDAMNDELSKIAARIDELKLPGLQRSNSYEQYDAVSNYVADAMGGAKDLYPAFDELPADIANEIGRLQKAYREVPVSYFEAKPRRVVQGNEFHAAYIPDDSSPEVMAHLERLGVKNIQKYLDKGDLDISLAKLAKEGKRGVSPYVLGLGGAIPTAGVLGNMFSQQPEDNMI